MTGALIPGLKEDYASLSPTRDEPQAGVTLHEMEQVGKTLAIPGGRYRMHILAHPCPCRSKVLGAREHPHPRLTPRHLPTQPLAFPPCPVGEALPCVSHRWGAKGSEHGVAPVQPDGEIPVGRLAKRVEACITTVLTARPIAAQVVQDQLATHGTPQTLAITYPAYMCSHAGGHSDASALSGTIAFAGL